RPGRREASGAGAMARREGEERWDRAGAEPDRDRAARCSRARRRRAEARSSSAAVVEDFSRRQRRGSWRWASALLEVAPAQQFGDLHGVQRSALAEIVADTPEGEAVVDGRILAHAADEGGIVA